MRAEGEGMSACMRGGGGREGEGNGDEDVVEVLAVARAGVECQHHLAIMMAL